MVEPGSRRIGLGLTLALVVVGCLLQILLVPHEVEGIGSAAAGEPPGIREVTRPRVASTTAPPGAMRARTPIPAPGPGGAPVHPVPAAIAHAAEPDSHREAAGILEVMGPSEAIVGDLVTFSIVMLDAPGAVYAPLVLGHDPDILGFVSAEEGSLFSMDGGETQFIAAPSHASGQVEIAISRIPPASGIEEGGGVLASVTFLVLGSGRSRVSLEGSRLVDPIGRAITFESREAVLLALGSGSGDLE